MEEKAPKLALFPVYLYEEGFEPPKTGTYYLVAKGGIYLHKETKAGNALVKTNSIPWLEEPSMEFRLKLPKIPGRIIGQALNFFRMVFDKYRSESYVTLLYSAKLNQYRLWCPKQKVSHGSVNYDRTDQPDYEDRMTNDWQMCGTIHSHCDFSAFHSGTDTHDEASFDGIHITLGHVNKSEFSMCASVAINDQRETLEPEQCCNGVIRVPTKETKYSKYMTFSDAYYFDLELPEEDAQGLVADLETIENEWMPKVEKETWSFFGSGKKKASWEEIAGDGGSEWRGGHWGMGENWAD